MSSQIYLFATSGGHFGELRQWVKDIEAEVVIYVDGPAQHKLGDNINHIKKIDSVFGALAASYSLVVQNKIQSPKAFVSAGAQNALTAYTLSIYHRVPYFYVESFQRTENLSRSGIFSILVAKKVFLFHDIPTEDLPWWLRIIIKVRKNIIISESIFEE